MGVKILKDLNTLDFMSLDFVSVEDFLNFKASNERQLEFNLIDLENSAKIKRIKNKIKCLKDVINNDNLNKFIDHTEKILLSLNIFNLEIIELNRDEFYDKFTLSDNIISYDEGEYVYTENSILCALENQYNYFNISIDDIKKCKHLDDESIKYIQRNFNLWFTKESSSDADVGYYKCVNNITKPIFTGHSPLLLLVFKHSYSNGEAGYNCDTYYIELYIVR